MTPSSEISYLPDSIIPDGNPQSLNRYSYVNNEPINHNDPTGHCLYGNVWVPDGTKGCYPGGYYAPTPLEKVDPSQLNSAGANGYNLYSQLWADRSSGAWWWTDKRLGGDGDFSVQDFIAVVLTMELSHGYSNQATFSLWQEALVRHASYNWQYGLSGNGPTSAGLINFMFGYSGTSRTASSFNSPIGGAIGSAITTAKAMIDPSSVGHPEWSQGKIGDRPFDVGSYNHKQPPSMQLGYIYGFIKAGCNGTTWPGNSCSEDNNFMFILTADESDFWSIWKP